MAIYIKDESGWQQLTGLDRPYANVGGVNISAAGYIPEYGLTLYGTSTPHGLNTGDIVTVSGVTPSSFNTTAVAYVFDSVQFYFTFFNGSTGGAYSSGGTTSTFKPVKNVYANVSGTWNETFSYFETSGGISYDAGAGYTGVYFTASGDFTILSGTRNIEYFIVGAGGGGGGAGNNSARITNGYGGGGGGGDYRTGTLSSVGIDTLSIGIGAGGAGGAGATSPFVTVPSNGSGGNAGFGSGFYYTPIGSTRTAINSTSSTAGGGGRGGTLSSATIGGNGGNQIDFNTGWNAGTGSNLTARGGGGPSGGSLINGGNATSTAAGVGATGINFLNSGTIAYGGTGGGGSESSSTRGSGGTGGTSGGAGSNGYGGVVYLRWLT